MICIAIYAFNVMKPTEWSRFSNTQILKIKIKIKF